MVDHGLAFQGDGWTFGESEVQGLCPRGVVCGADPRLCIWKCNNYAASYVVRSPDQRETADLPEALARGKRTIPFVGQGPTSRPIPGTHRVMLKYKEEDCFARRPHYRRHLDYMRVAHERMIAAAGTFYVSS
jgi:hypothetical protein